MTDEKLVRRTFDKILAMMAIDWEESSGAQCDGAITTAYNAKLSQRFANLTVALYASAVILYSSSVLANHRAADDGSSNGSARPFILKIDLPFDSDRRFVYESILIIQFLHLLMCSVAIGMLNALLINLILHVGGQIDILHGWLIDIFPKKGERDLSVAVVKRVIEKHRKIIVFSGHIEDLYSAIALVLFVSDTLTICSLGFILVAVSGSDWVLRRGKSIGTSDALKIIIRTFLFYLVMNLEAFIFCFAGEYLSAKSRTVADAAYDSLWYESSSKDGRIILFLMMRSQNQLTITIGKVMNLSLERFGNIVKASASYISVLLAMY